MVVFGVFATPFPVLMLSDTVRIKTRVEGGGRDHILCMYIVWHYVINRAFTWVFLMNNFSFIPGRYLSQDLPDGITLGVLTIHHCLLVLPTPC